MNLYINTSGKTCELALFEDQKPIHTYTNTEPMQHSRLLHSAIEDLLNEAQSSFDKLTSISVLNGPGSYTGLRVGLAAAKTFCYVKEIPLILFNKLNIYCDYYLDSNSEITKVACLIHAREGEVFCSAKNKEEVIIEPNVYKQDELETLLLKLDPENDLVLISPTGQNNVKNIWNQIEFIEIPLSYIGKSIHTSLKTNNFSDIMRSEPFYLKKVHANQPKSRFL